MTRTGILAAAGLAVLLPLTAFADEAHVVASPAAVKWSPAPPFLPKGAQVAVLLGDPKKEAPFILRLKVPAGYKVPAHLHPIDENLTVLSGALHIGMGDKLDPANGEVVAPGGFVHMPKGMHHYAWFTQETVLQSAGVGPFGITYINPADDPRKTN